MKTTQYQSGVRQISFRDDTMTSAPIYTSPFESMSPLPLQNPSAGFFFADEFVNLNTVASTGLWQTVKGTGGTIALASSVGGIINLPTAASSNDYISLASQKALFQFSAGVPIAFEFAVNLTEANTNTASWFCGLTSVTTAGFIQNSGAPATSYSGCVFWKATGAMSLSFQTSNGSTQTTITNPITAVSGQTYYLGAFLDPNDGTTGKVTYFISTASGSPKVRSLVQTGTVNLALGSLAAMNVMLGVNTGSTNAETLTCDYVEVWQTRVVQ